MATFKDNANAVRSFMEEVQLIRDNEQAEELFRNSYDNKARMIEREKNAGREYCLNNIFKAMYKDAIPLNDEYKDTCCGDIDVAFKDFMDTRCPKGLEFYVKEGIKKNSPFAKKVLEAVNELINNQYYDKAMNLEDINADDLVFRSSDDIQKRLDIIGKDLSTDEITQAVRDNVKHTVLSEILRAKKEKENLKKVESELASDVKVTTPEQLSEAMELRDINQVRDYNPSLFEAILVNKMNKNVALEGSGQFVPKANIYGTLDEYGYVEAEGIPAGIDEVAFIEAVEELTMLELLKTLKLESFGKYVNQDLIDKYTTEKF